MQRDLILSKNAVPKLEELSDCYTIRQVYITDPDSEALTAVCRLFDPDDVYIAGTAPESDRQEYWENLAELRIRISERQNKFTKKNYVLPPTITTVFSVSRAKIPFPRTPGMALIAASSPAGSAIVPKEQSIT